MREQLRQEVLRRSARGHTAEDVEHASKLIKASGFRLILQMMTGLPGDTAEKDIETARKIIALEPDGVRIYPTVIVRDTALYDMWRAGKYREHTVEDAVSVCAQLVPLFEAAGIPIIRLGLNPTDDLSGGDAVGGAYHPALGELVRSRIMLQKARELLRGVLFFLAVPEEPEASSQPEDVGSRYEAERADRIRVLLPLDLADELARGQRRAQRDAALTIALWRKVVEMLPPLENRSLRDTLRSIGRGFRCYDTRFFPQRFDCDIDYQLAVPVSESLLGINYVNQYLDRLAAENSLLTRLPQGEVRAVLERSCPDWRGLLVNLYAPVAANALARTLLGGEGLTLSERLALPRGAGKYLSGFAREVAVRAEALRDCGGLRGVFV